MSNTISLITDPILFSENLTSDKIISIEDYGENNLVKVMYPKGSIANVEDMTYYPLVMKRSLKFDKMTGLPISPNGDNPIEYEKQMSRENIGVLSIIKVLYGATSSYDTKIILDDDENFLYNTIETHYIKNGSEIYVSINDLYLNSYIGFQAIPHSELFDYVIQNTQIKISGTKRSYSLIIIPISTLEESVEELFDALEEAYDDLIKVYTPVDTNEPTLEENLKMIKNWEGTPIMKIGKNIYYRSQRQCEYDITKTYKILEINLNFSMPIQLYITRRAYMDLTDKYEGLKGKLKDIKHVDGGLFLGYFETLKQIRTFKSIVEKYEGQASVWMYVKLTDIKEANRIKKQIKNYETDTKSMYVPYNNNTYFVWDRSSEFDENTVMAGWTGGSVLWKESSNKVL